MCEFETGGPEGIVESVQIVKEGKASASEAVDCKWYIRAPPRSKVSPKVTPRRDSPPGKCHSMHSFRQAGRAQCHQKLLFFLFGFRNAPCLLLSRVTVTSYTTRRCCRKSGGNLRKTALQFQSSEQGIEMLSLSGGTKYYNYTDASQPGIIPRK